MAQSLIGQDRSTLCMRSLSLLRRAERAAQTMSERCVCVCVCVRVRACLREAQAGCGAIVLVCRLKGC
jgi:hypothetical protein